MRPVAEDLTKCAFAEKLRGLTDNLLAELVPGHSTVLIVCAEFRRNDKRGIHDNQVKLLPLDRLVKIPFEKVDVGESIEPSVKGGKIACPWVSIDGNNPLTVSSGQKGLHPAAGAKIQGQLGRTTDGESA